MDLQMLRCPNCHTAFGVDKESIGDDAVVTCPSCEEEVDTTEDVAEVL